MAFVVYNSNNQVRKSVVILHKSNKIYSIFKTSKQQLETRTTTVLNDLFLAFTPVSGFGGKLHKHLSRNCSKFLCSSEKMYSWMDFFVVGLVVDIE